MFAKRNTDGESNFYAVTVNILAVLYIGLPSHPHTQHKAACVYVCMPSLGSKLGTCIIDSHFKAFKLLLYLKIWYIS